MAESSGNIPQPPPSPVISVVVRAHNSRDRIERAVVSVLRQDESDWELIVVDDGSTDGTADWIRRTYAGERRMRLIVGASRRGAAAAANVGIERARGGLLALLDSDDEWDVGFLATMRRALEAEPRAMAGYADHVQVWDEVAIERTVRAPAPEDQGRAMLLAPFIPCLSQMLFRRDALISLGRFDERLAIVSDRDMLFRAVLRHPRPFLHVGQPLARRHFHAANLMHDADASVTEGRALLDRAFRHPAAAAHRSMRDQAMAGVAARAAAFGRQRATLLAAPTASISVVIPTRNRCDLLQQAIASVDRQAYRNRELIVVDDGSSDGTDEWLRSLGRDDIRLLAGEARGVAAARNLGNVAASGDIVAGLDDHDRWLPDYLTAVATAFALAPAPVFSFTDVFTLSEPDGDAVHVRHASPGGYPDLVRQMLGATFPICPSIFAARRDVLASVGGYDPNFLEGAELDLYLRLLTHQFRPRTEAQESHAPAHIARTLARCLVPSSGATADRSRAERNRVLDRFFASPAGAPYRDHAFAAEPSARPNDAMGVDAGGSPANSIAATSEDTP